MLAALRLANRTTSRLARFDRRFPPSLLVLPPSFRSQAIKPTRPLHSTRRRLAMPPKLDLSQAKALTTAVESRDAAALAAPFLSEPFTSFNLFPHIVSQLLIQALAKPADIDDLVSLVLSASSKLQQAHPEEFNEVREPSYFSAGLPDVQGLGKGLVAQLVSELHTALLPQVQRAVTPDPEGDGLLSSAYYHRALCHGLFVGRLFASEEPQGVDSRALTWPVIEDVLRKGLLAPPAATGGNPAPGSLLASSVILHSSGLALSRYLKPSGNAEGKGLNHVWYDDKLKLPDATWGWEDVVEKATGGLNFVGSLEPAQLAAYVDKVAKEAARSPQNASSADVVSSFGWIADVPLQPSSRGGSHKPSSNAKLDAKSLATSAILEKDISKRLSKLAQTAEGIRRNHAASGLHGDVEKLEDISKKLAGIEETLKSLR